eukprot:scaffold288740_cov35-Tisochrysis_lutea.AAC.1
MSSRHSPVRSSNHENLRHRGAPRASGSVTRSSPVDRRSMPSSVRSSVVGTIWNPSVDSLSRPSSGRESMPGATIHVRRSLSQFPGGRSATRMMSSSSAVRQRLSPPPSSTVHPPACSLTSAASLATRAHTRVIRTATGGSRQRPPRPAQRPHAHAPTKYIPYHVVVVVVVVKRKGSPL